MAYIKAGITGSNVPCHNMDHNGHGINMILMGNLHAGGHFDRGNLSPSTPKYPNKRRIMAGVNFF